MTHRQLFYQAAAMTEPGEMASECAGTLRSERSLMRGCEAPESNRKEAGVKSKRSQREAEKQAAYPERETRERRRGAWQAENCYLESRSPPNSLIWEAIKFDCI